MLFSLRGSAGSIYCSGPRPAKALEAMAEEEKEVLSHLLEIVDSNLTGTPTSFVWARVLEDSVAASSLASNINE